MMPLAVVRHRLGRAVVSTLGLRVVSALLSFVVFAQVAAKLPPGPGARVLFFSFAFGFALATLRGFHVIHAAVTGHERCVQRWRQVRRSARVTTGLAMLVSPGTAALLLSQGVPWGVALAGAALTIACAADIDLARAVLRRAPLLPLLTATGGALGCTLLLLVPAPDERLCAIAFLLQWLPVALQQLVLAPRLLRRAQRRPTPGSRRAWPAGVGAGLLLAGFDGAVLNAPFILALPLPAAQALDLALGNRLFVASLALFALIGTWVISGDVARVARRLRIGTALAFGLLQGASGLVLGAVYALIFAGVAAQRVGVVALLVFAVLLLAYCAHAAAVRFAAPAVPVALRMAAYGLTLAAFYALMLWQRGLAAPSLAVIVVCVVGALLLPAAALARVSTLRRRRRASDSRPENRL